MLQFVIIHILMETQIAIREVIDKYMMVGSGRRTKCSPDLIEDIILLISRGLSIRDTCAMVGITNSTYLHWMNRGNKELKRLEQTFGTWEVSDIEPSEAIFLLFSINVKKAIPARKMELINRIRIAGQDPKSWQANAWILERIHPDEFGRKTQVEVKDWRSELIELIKNGQVTFEVLEDEFGQEDAKRLYESAGVESTSG